MSEELVSTGGAEMGTLGPLASRKTVAGAKLAERIQAGSSGRVSVGVQGAVGGRPGHCDGSSDSSAPEKQRGEGNSKRAMCGGAGGGSSGRGKDIADGRHVNTRIQKYFPGHGTFNGIVTAYYPSHNTYHIRYDDNDDEIISYKSLLRLIENKSASASEVQAVACSALAEDVEDLSGEGSSKQAAQGETARKCEHNRQRCECKDCGGGSICEHNRRRSRCTECGGGSICEHNRERSRCKDCGGGSICQHKRRRSQCKECGGGGICEHKRRRSDCKECRGGSICQHKRRRSTCKECAGASICEHKRIRGECKECGGGSICEHKRRRSTCKECGGGSICEHNRERRKCKQCGGSRICQHNRERSRCKECGGGGICKHARIRSKCKECKTDKVTRA